jgi:hypothetical protein
MVIVLARVRTAYWDMMRAMGTGNGWDKIYTHRWYMAQDSPSASYSPSRSKTSYIAPLAKPEAFVILGSSFGVEPVSKEVVRYCWELGVTSFDDS